MTHALEHTVGCPVPRDFAWQFWSRVENWRAVDPSVESVSLDGPFAAGTKGSTKPRGLPPAQWELAEVQEGRRAAIEVALPGAVLRFLWVFEEAGPGAARITQRVPLEGERAGGYAGAMAEFADGIPAGMQSLAAAMSKAASNAARLPRNLEPGG